MPSTNRDDLFAVDPNDFVETRDRLVRELRSEGDKDSAREVKLLRRPAVPVWALNQVARSDPALIGAVVASAAQARQAQVDVMNGADSSALRRALADRRDAIENVTAAAAARIDDSGRSSAAYERELVDTLNAIVSNETLTGELQAGRLVNIPIVGDSEVDVFAGMPAPSQPRTDRNDTPRRPRTSDEHVAAVKREREEAKARLRDADKAYRDAIAARDEARRALERAEHAVAEADRNRSAARAAVDRHE